MHALPERYAFRGALGQGGMGAVYSAYDRVREQLVAFKRLQIEPGDPHREERVALFRREFRTLSTLQHPRVIMVYDYGVDDEGPYYTMELLDGEDLQNKAPLPWPQACALLRDVCSSLSLLHSRGFVHRDVSPQNVRCTSDGRAKLIDFGAMAPMGGSAKAVGTPPCVAPECLTRFPLDGRTDVFAVGAALYFALTRTHAFPARHFAQLSLLHQYPLAPPSSKVSDIPSALDTLVLSMLSTDPMARPRHPAEVMDRLTALARLGPAEPLEVRLSYLDTPALVGMESPSARLSQVLARLKTGRPARVRVHGLPGSGRSRMLQALAIEARLSGVAVVAASAANAGVLPFALVRSLVAETATSAEGMGEHLARYASELQPLMTPGEAGPEDGRVRQKALRALAAAMQDGAGARPLMVVVDDVERCDEGSLAALATLATSVHDCAFAIVIADATGAVPAAGNQAFELLHEVCEPIELPPLTDEQTEMLLRSVFGPASNLQTAARFVFERAAGSPRATMELAQQLVDRGLAHYSLGTWTLPSQLDECALPASLHDVRRERLAALHADARELAEVLVLAEPFSLALPELAQACDHGDPQRLAAAHETLVEARIIDPAAGHTLADRTWAELVQRGLAPERSRVVHGRIARLLRASGAGPLRLTRCLLSAGEHDQALDILCATIRAGSLAEGASDDYPELLQRALSACRDRQRLPSDHFVLQRELVNLADRFSIEGMTGHFQAVIERLSLDCGLNDYYALAGQIPEDERLEHALARAQARHDSVPEAERVLSPLEAVKGLVETVYAGAVYAALVGDRAFLDTMPSLRPFQSLSPLIGLVTAAMDSHADLIGARYDQALENYTQRLSSLEDFEKLAPPQVYESRKRLLIYALGSLKAGTGVDGALEHADALDQAPEGEILAASVRQCYYMRQGNTQDADRWRQRLELLQVQHKRPHALKIRQTTQQIEAAAYAGDLENIRRHLEGLQELVRVYPSCMPYVDYGHAACQRICGDHAAALQHIRRCLDATAAGCHPVWPWAVCVEIECTSHEAGPAVAVELARSRLNEARQAELIIMGTLIEVALAVLESELGEFASAVERLGRAMAARERRGSRGLNAGYVYEARARVAIRMGERKVYETYLERCRESFREGRDSPALAARLARLQQESKLRWGAPARAAQPVEEAVTVLRRTKRRPAIMTQLAGLDPPGRASEALRLLLSAVARDRGQLYLLRGGTLCLAASVHVEGDHSDLIDRQLRALADIEEEDSGVTATVCVSDSTTIATDDLSWYLLSCLADGRISLVGAIVLPGLTAQDRERVSPVASAISSTLIELGDVTPLASA